MNDLKPCPFCGGRADFRFCGGVYLAECTVCYTSQGDDGGDGMDEIRKQTIANWNRRAEVGFDCGYAAALEDAAMICDVAARGWVVPSQSPFASVAASIRAMKESAP